MSEKTIYKNLPIVSAKCTGLDDLGQGVCKDNDNILFARGLLPGEEGEVQLRAVKGKVAFGDTIKVTKKSPDRVKCPFELTETGISDLGHLRYEKRLIYKQENIRNLIKKFTHLDIEVKPTIPCPLKDGFRNKIQRPVKYSAKEKKIVSGYYRINTHKLVEMEHCPIESKLSDIVLTNLLTILNKYNIQAYDEDSQVGLLRHILIRTSYNYQEALVTLVVTSFEIPNLDNIVKDLIDICPEVKSITLNLNKRRTNVILGMLDKVVYGDGHIKDSILGKTFIISAKSFYQTNPSLLDQLYGKAIEGLDLNGTETILDAYCGTGTIGICMADKAKRVVGVEIESSSYEDALTNAKNNHIKNINFHLDDATEYLQRTDEHFDCIVLDPPRKGTTPEFIKALIKNGPEKVAYISCDPATLARDLNLLKDDYSIVSVQGVDIFPASHHVETVVLLSRICSNN